MCDSNTVKAKRIVAGIMGFVVLIIALFFAFYIAAEAEHDCTGEDCPICACIHQCENILRRFADAMTSQLSAVVRILIVLLIAVTFVAAMPQKTLVTRKVRLNY